jgi:non-ribosomal peptide synthetase component F
VHSYRGAKRELVLPGDIASAVEEFSRRESLTPFMTLLAALNILLARYSGQEDILVGSPIANRTRPEIEPLIGFFANTLVLRTGLGDNPNFVETARRVREVALGAYAHQDMPFESLLEVTGQGRDLARNPLFQVMFTLQNAAGEKFELPDLTAQLLETDNKTSKFDLTFNLTETAEGLRGWIEYNADIFEPETIARMAAHFKNILRAALERPYARVMDLPLLSDGERRQLIYEWNDTRRAYKLDLCLHHLFERQASLKPDAIAVEFEGRKLTYRQLDGRANRLAWHLRKLGVGPEVRAGVMISRSIDMVVAMLGVLKAGGAYVPLDPGYPAERFNYIIGDARIRILLIEQAFKDQLHQYSGEVVSIDGDWETISQQSDRHPGSTTEAIWLTAYTRRVLRAGRRE